MPSVLQKAGKWAIRLVGVLAKAHYREFAVKDSEGEVIGHEFASTRNICVFVPIEHDLDDSSQDPSVHEEEQARPRSDEHQSVS